VHACTNLALKYREGKGVTVDPVHAAELYQRACTGNHAQSCSDLAFMTLEGEGIKKDRPRAIALFGMACSAGEAWACGKRDRLQNGE
jgi:TPR repeat protein